MKDWWTVSKAGVKMQNCQINMKNFKFLKIGSGRENALKTDIPNCVHISLHFASPHSTQLFTPRLDNLIHIIENILGIKWNNSRIQMFKWGSHWIVFWGLAFTSVKNFASSFHLHIKDDQKVIEKLFSTKHECWQWWPWPSIFFLKHFRNHPLITNINIKQYIWHIAKKSKMLTHGCHSPLTQLPYNSAKSVRKRLSSLTLNADNRCILILALKISFETWPVVDEDSKDRV